jgi:hypothetical protein
MINNIVIFCTKTIPEYIGKMFQRNQNSKMGKLDNKLDNTEEREQTNWVEDFDERERNSR